MDHSQVPTQFSKEKKKGKAMDNPTTTTINKEELMKQLDTKMKESQLLKTSVEHSITTGLLAIPQASIAPIDLAIGIVPKEGTSQTQGAKESIPSTQIHSTTMVLVHERVIIHNIDSDSKEDD